jgi:putative ABC transport system permease protein
MNFLKSLFESWLWKMAWRDSRSSRKRLLIFMSSIIMGIAALMAISSFGVNLQLGLERQAKTLLGADLVVRSRQPLSDEAEKFIHTLGGETAREISFSSMVFFPKNGATRLAQIRATDGKFPFYGELETTPPLTATGFMDGPIALVEDGLMLQYDVQNGDVIKIGAFEYSIGGRLKKVPGETTAAGIIGARVYIPIAYLGRTRLFQKGSAATYKVYFKLPPQPTAEQIVKDHQSEFLKLHLDTETVEERKANLGRSLENAYDFLNLVGFISLLLGSIGVASAIHVYVKQKISTIAVMRCLGAREKQTISIYLIQTFSLGLVGAVCGILLGLGIQYLLPHVLGDFLPMSVPFLISWKSLVKAVGVGLGVSVLFSLLPLLAIRKVSPLLAIRASYEIQRTLRDPLRWFLYGLILAGVGAFAVTHTRRWFHGIFFTGGLLIALGLLAGVARLLMWLTKRFLRGSFPYVWRQGLANLYRPHNQTLVLMLSLGLGTFLMSTLYLVHSVLMNQVFLMGRGHQPNLILFDIQPDQKEEVGDLVRSNKLPILQETPVVTMRLSSIRGRAVSEILKDPKNSIQESWLQREYRSTYRDTLIDTEKLVLGKWQARVNGDTEPILVSLEEGIAKRLKVGIGDQLVFDVQGLPLATTVGSLRKVEWERVQPNFFVVFPAGVLESAPQFLVMVLRVNDNAESARLQRAVVQQFPNVSAIDLSLIVTMIDGILDRVSFVIRFMALFSIFTGLLVLAGAVIAGKYQRMKESVLLRTLGASRAQIRDILMIEYLFLGEFAALTGMLLALLASWALARFVFETGFAPSWVFIFAGLVVVPLLAIGIGMLNSRGIANRPPLEVLRAET